MSRPALEADIILPITHSTIPAQIRVEGRHQVDTHPYRATSSRDLLPRAETRPEKERGDGSLMGDWTRFPVSQGDCSFRAREE